MSKENAVESRLVDNAITQKDFISPAEARKFGVNSPEGTIKWLGTIIGKTTGGKEKITTQPDGNQLRSFQFEGIFECYIYDTDETKSARSVFLPKSIANELELTLREALESGDKDTTVQFALEIGIEATGRNIPFGYKIRSFGKQRTDLLSDMRSMLPPRGQPALIASSEKQAEPETEAETKTPETVKAKKSA